MPIYFKYQAKLWGRQSIVCATVRYDTAASNGHTRITILQSKNLQDITAPKLQANELLSAAQLEQRNGLTDPLIRMLNLGATKVTYVATNVLISSRCFNRFDLELMDLHLTSQQISSLTPAILGGNTSIGVGMRMS